MKKGNGIGEKGKLAAFIPVKKNDITRQAQ